MSYTDEEWVLKLRYRIDDAGATQLLTDEQLSDIALECVRTEGYDDFADVDDKFVNLILKHATAESWYALSKHYSEEYASAQSSKQKFSKTVGGGALSVSFEDGDIDYLKDNAIIAYRNGRNAFEQYIELKRNLLTERQPEPSTSTAAQHTTWDVSKNDFGEDTSDWSDSTKIKVKY